MVHLFLDAGVIAILVGLWEFFNRSIISVNFCINCCINSIFLPVKFTLPELPARYVKLAILVGLSLSVLAVAAILIDRISRGIDFSQGVCYARVHMTRLGIESGPGINSPFSFFGNLFGPAFLVPVAAVILQPVSRRLAWTVGLVSFASLLALSTVTASRTGIMLTGAFVTALCCLRLMANLPLPRLKWRDGIGVVFIVALSAAFLLSIFVCRAQISDMDTSDYIESFSGHLGFVSEPGNADRGRIFSVLGMAVLYVTHSAYTFAGIIGLEEKSGMIIFGAQRFLLARVGIDLGSAEWAFQGRFPSVPGMFYHDFGLLGLIVLSLLLAGLVIGTLHVLKVMPGLLTIGVAALAMTTLFLSPMLFAPDIIIFTFVAAQFVMVPAISWLAYQLLAKTWTGSDSRQRR